MMYLVLTPNLGLWYSGGSRFELLGYSDAKWIERVPSSHFQIANLLSDPLSLSLQSNKILLSYSQPKQSMSPSVVVVHNYFVCEKISRTMVTL
jgi:hypothetical protein